MKKILATAVLAVATLLSTTAHAGASLNGASLNGITLNGMYLNGTGTGSQSGKVIAVELPGKVCTRNCGATDEPNGRSEHGLQ